MYRTPPAHRNRIFHAFRWLVEACWYINFGLIAIGLYFLIKTMFGEPSADFSALVRLNAPLSSIPVPGATIEARDAMVHLHVPNNLFNQVTAFLFFFLFEILLISALYNIRRVLRSLLAHSPFSGETIYRLRLTALFIGLFAPYNLLLSITQSAIVQAQIPEAAQSFRINWNLGLPYIVVAVVIYLLVDVFRYGLQLQQENEAFV